MIKKGKSLESNINELYHFIFTILEQFFLNRSHPNVRIAREKPNTCESIQAERMAMVLSGFSSDAL